MAGARVRSRDPAALRNRIAELEAKLAAAAPDNTGLLARLCDARTSIDVLGRQLDAAIVAIGKGDTGVTTIEIPPPTQEQAQRTYRRLHATDSPQTGRQAVPRAEPSPATREAAGSERRSQGVTAGETALPGENLPRGELLVLRALRRYPKGLRRDHLAELTGYRRSTIDAYIARLRKRWLVKTNLMLVMVTPAGVAAARGPHVSASATLFEVTP